MAARLVREVFPEVYADIVRLVEADGHQRLLEALPELAVVEPCSCGDSFCASFYTGARPRGTWSDEGHARSLRDADTKLVFSVDVVDDAIRYVEIISAQTDAGQRVASRLRQLEAGAR